MLAKPHALAAVATFFLASAFAPAPFSAPRFDDEDEAEEAEEEEEQDHWFAAVGGDVHSGLGGVLRGATVLAKNGVIEEIGYDLWIPEEAEIIDVSGLRIYPGLVAVNASSRIPEGTSPFSEEDFTEDIHDLIHRGGDLHEGTQGPLGGAHVEEVGPAYVDYVDPGELDVDYGHDEHEAEGEDAFQGSEGGAYASDLGDSFDPFNHYLVLTLATGITTVGQSKATFKLKRREIDGVVIRDDVLQTLSYSQTNPRNIQSLREKFATAADYQRRYRDYEERKKEDKELEEPSRRGVDTTALRILEGEKTARFNVSSREELQGIARLAQQFDFRPVIFGCDEGWTIASELGRAGASAVITPRNRQEKDERLVRAGGSSIENAALLHEHGVQVAVIPNDTSINLMGIAGRDLMHLPIEAAFAVRGGLPELAALQSITLIPARVLGVDHRVGSLEVGKDCDLIVTDGDLLHYETFVQYTVVEGKVVYDKDEELFFQHIRPRAKATEEEAPAEDAGADEVDADEDENEG